MPESVGRGKWSLADVPHKGWECVAFEDLEEPAATCEMCESAEIRYVHTMQHPDYADTLRCGKICAGHMANDYAAADERERRAQNRAARRVTWLSRAWRLSQSDNWYLNTEGFNITIYWKSGAWRARIVHRETGRGFWSKRSYATDALAKLASLDALLFIKGHSEDLI